MSATFLHLCPFLQRPWMPKAIKSSNISKGSSSKSTPFTPVRRLFFKLDHLRPSNRHRSQNAQYQEPIQHGNPEPDPVVNTPPSTPPPGPSTSERACMALQNDDLAEDAVVITTLSTLPFCCHEDLLTMTRPALVAVAESLNARLPGALRISLSRTHTDTAIRNEIEFVVGLRTEMPMPPAPRAPRTDVRHVPEVDADEEMNRTPPTSPSSRRGRRKFQIYGTPGTPMLERLLEEDEEGGERPMKRHRRQFSTFDETDDSMDVDVCDTPTPMPIQSRAHVMPSRSEDVQASPSPTPRLRVLRSHSTKLPTEMVNNDVINTERRKCCNREGLEVSRRRHASQPALIRKASAAKQKARAVSTTAACRAFVALQSTTMSSLTSQESVEDLPASSDSHQVGMKRRSSIETVEKGMGIGMIGMNMRSSARSIVDMDVE